MTCVFKVVTLPKKTEERSVIMMRKCFMSFRIKMMAQKPPNVTFDEYRRTIAETWIGLSRSKKLQYWNEKRLNK
jgi:hypothetical protein